jgi:mRNA-degrading endonuclease RelE of RelBE toxin-antitoxin system
MTADVADSTNTLVRNPHRVGKPLRFELAGIWAARRGTYRVLYRVNDTTREVIVLQSNTAGTRIAR